jgi:hypothetical protein
LSASFDPKKTDPEKLGARSRDDEEGDCPKCGGPLRWRQAHPYPLVRQALFGGSFVVFLFLFDRIHGNRWIVALWCALQILLGLALIRGRMLAKCQVLRCIRCSTSLP